MIGSKKRHSACFSSVPTPDGQLAEGQKWASGPIYGKKSPPPYPGGTGGRYGGGYGGEVRGGVRGEVRGGGYGGEVRGGCTGGVGTGDLAVHTQGGAHIGRCIHKAVHTKGGL